jgi:hypothetical protein
MTACSPKRTIDTPKLLLLLLTLSIFPVAGKASTASSEPAARISAAQAQLKELQREMRRVEDRWKAATNYHKLLGQRAEKAGEQLQQSSTPEGVKAEQQSRIINKLSRVKKNAQRLSGKIQATASVLSKPPLVSAFLPQNIEAIEIALEAARVELGYCGQELKSIEITHGDIARDLKEAEELARRFPPAGQKRPLSLEQTRDDYLKQLQAAGSALDTINSGLREFGSITMSAPLLSSPDTNLFAFNYTHGTSNYVADAKAHRDFEMAYFEQVLSAFAAKVSVEMNPDVMKQYQRDLGDYLSGRERLQQGQGLLDGAMRTNFMAAVERAVQETNSDTRTLILTNALNSYRGYLTNSLLGTGTNPTITNYPAPSGTNPLPEHLDLSKYLDTVKLKGPLGLLTNSNKTAIPNRAALVTAAGDQVVEGIFKLLGDPAKAAPFKDKLTLFSAVTVGVDPGWRTAKDYAADVLIQTEFIYQEARPEVVRAFATNTNFPLKWRARLLEDADMAITPADIGFSGTSWPGPCDSIPSWLDGRKHLRDAERGTAKAAPIVYAVSPLTETVVMSQEASLRSQRQLALSLGALFQGAGYQAQGAALLQYAEQLQTDVRGVSATAAMNAYSAGGGISGFQVGPRFKAIADPSKKRKDAGFVLERQSFPALFILGFDRADIQPMLRWETNSSGVVRLALVEPTFRFTQTARWLPLTNPNCDPTLSSRMTERWRLETSYKAAEARLAAFNAAKTLGRMPGGQQAAWLANDQLELLGRRNDPIRYLAMGNYSDQCVPMELMLPSKPKEAVEQVKTPVITGVEPAVINLPAPETNQPPQHVYVMVKGENLGSEKSEVGIVPPSTEVTAVIIGRAKEGLTVKITLTPAKTTQALLQFTLPMGDTRLKAFAPPVTINLPKVKQDETNQAKANPLRTFHLSYESQGTNGTAKSEDLKISGDVTLEQLQKLQALELGSSKRPSVEAGRSQTSGAPAPADKQQPTTVIEKGGGKSGLPPPTKKAEEADKQVNSPLPKK